VGRSHNLHLALRAWLAWQAEHAFGDDVALHLVGPTCDAVPGCSAMTMPTKLMERAHDEVMAEDGPTLPDKPRRRMFTAEYKLATVEEYDACVGDGDKGALLRREGHYSSHIVEWRRARDAAGK
jgi:hypothetical protein